MRSLLWALLAIALALLAAGPAAADCKMHHGDLVVLYSSTDDPDVFVWDSRFRLREYHAASFDEGRQILRHAELMEPGTRAVVDSCVPDFVLSPLFDHPADAVGILVISGPHRGERGWVLGTDLKHYHY